MLSYFSPTLMWDGCAGLEKNWKGYVAADASDIIVVAFNREGEWGGLN